MQSVETVGSLEELEAKRVHALKNLEELRAESKTLPARLHEASQAAQRRKIERAKLDSAERVGIEAAAVEEDRDSELAALLRRQEELPFDLLSARIAVAELDTQAAIVRKARHQRRYEELIPDVELAKDGLEDARAHYNAVKLRQDDEVSGMNRADGELMRASDVLNRLEHQGLGV